jgi:hypothetical protein
MDAYPGEGVLESAFVKQGLRAAQIDHRRCPLVRHALSGVFQQCVAEGGDGLLEPRGAALACPQPRKRVAEVVLRRRPLAQ